MNEELTLAVIESPYSAPSLVRFAMHVRYARAAVLDAIELGYAPLASHLLYPQEGILSEASSSDRERGIRAGHVPYAYVLPRYDESPIYGLRAATFGRPFCLVYPDFGISDGMRAGIKEAKTHGCQVLHRSLADKRELFLDPSPEQALAIICAGLSTPDCVRVRMIVG
jgi:hypothetical protein